jgi:hypothetical protein
MRRRGRERLTEMVIVWRLKVKGRASLDEERTCTCVLEVVLESKNSGDLTSRKTKLTEHQTLCSLLVPYQDSSEYALPKHHDFLTSSSHLLHNDQPFTFPRTCHTASLWQCIVPCVLD